MNPLAEAAVRASAVLLIGLALRGALRRRSPAVRHAILAAAIAAAPLVAAIGASTPGVAVPVPAMRWPGPAAVGATPARTDAGDGSTAAASPRVPAPPRPAVPGIAWHDAAGALWAAGALGFVAWLIAAALRVRRVASRGTPLVEGAWALALDRACHAASLARPVRLLAVADTQLLATWGSRRPRIVVPASALGWGDDRIRTVLTHEVAHVVRHDWLVQALADGVRALLWWNPLAWLACRALRHDSERACDDAVLRAGTRPAAYAHDLLQIARLLAPAAEAAPGVMRMARTSTLERRIVAMLNPTLDRRAPTRRTLTAAAAAVAALVLPVALLRAAQSGRQPLEGVVYDTTGAVLPGARVALDAEAIPGASVAVEAAAATVRTTTDAAGRFRFDGVEPGPHTLQVALGGFRALHQPIQLKADADWSRAVTLQIGDLKETVSVRQRRPASITPLHDPTGPPTPVRVGGNIRAPRKTYTVSPTYPPRMVEAGLEGQVSIEAVIATDGRVVRARATTAQVHPELAQAAVDAVRQWRFEPTLLNGSPVEVVMSVSIDFNLE